MELGSCCDHRHGAAREDRRQLGTCGEAVGVGQSRAAVPEGAHSHRVGVAAHVEVAADNKGAGVAVSTALGAV